MIDKNAIDNNALHYYRKLKEAGFSAYFVGGSVRDLLLGKRPKDFDIATNATPQQIRRVTGGRIIGRRFRHVMLERDGGRYEIVTFRGPVIGPETEEPEDDSDAPETENKRKFPDLNQFGTAEQDALRRDFTINALFYDPDADELVDYVEGKIDVDRRVLRSIGDASARMEEDPIRILRAVRHRVKLGLHYDSALEAAMRDKAPLLENTSKDRIREEFLKVCNDQSLGAFLTELKNVGILANAAPWFKDLSPEDWHMGERLWDAFSAMPSAGRPSPELGVALTFAPLVRTLVLDPYKASISPEDRNQYPDMKYFLSVETLRDHMLRQLRISRAQTDHIVRTLFYWSRMTTLWVENGPPRRLIGKLFHHPPAVLAAKMARLSLHLDGRDIPPWMNDLADYTPGHRNERGERNERDERDRGPTREREVEDRPMGRRLQPPTEPMVWNGPLHAPVLRPNFPSEPSIRWARKDQSIRAFRPSGIPNQPTDYASLKSHLVSNYKPELETASPSHESSEGGGRRDRNDRGNRGEGRRGRGRDRGRGREREPAPPSHTDEDSIGNTLRPGERHAALGPSQPSFAGDADDDLDDNIGNRIDAPVPRSGHFTSGEQPVVMTHHIIQQRRGGGGGEGGGNGRRRRRGGRNRRRG